MYVALFNDEDFSWYSNEIESVLPRDAVLSRYMLLSFVCPSIRHKPICRTTIRIELVFGVEDSFDRSQTVLGPIRKFGHLPKVTGLASGTLPQTLELENFAMASRWCGQQNSSTVELVNFHLRTVDRMVAGCTKFITRWSTVTL